MHGITRIHRPFGSLSASLIAHREPNRKDGDNTATGLATLPRYTPLHLVPTFGSLSLCATRHLRRAPALIDRLPSKRPGTPPRY